MRTRLGIGPEARMGNVEFLMRVHRGDDAGDGGGVFFDEGGDAEGVVGGGGDGEGSAGVEVFLDVDEE